MIRFRQAGWLAIIPLAGGCAPTDAPSAAFTVRDSAGVEIVESTAPAWTEDAWRIDSIADLDLSGQDDEELSGIRSVRLLNGGRIAFYNDAACEIRIHDAVARRIAVFGRCGEGPGEFDDFGSLWPWRADSILVVDQLTRITIVDSAGSVGRTLRLPTTSEMRIPFIRGVLENYMLLLMGLQDPAGRATPGVEAGRSVIGTLRELDDSIEILGLYPGPLFEYTEFDGRLGRGRLAFSSATELASGTDRVYIGFPDRYEIHVYAPERKLLRIIRRAFSPVTVEQGDIDWLMERRLAEVEGEDNQRLVRQAFRELRHADVMPGFGVPVWPGGADGGPTMIADAEGNLWVFAHYRPGEYRNEWTVFSPAGVWLGQLILPDHFTPAHIASDHVIGTWTDDDGFVHVRRHRINKQ